MLDPRENANASDEQLRLGSILILEDEVLLSVMLEDLVREMGAQRVFVCTSADEARRVAAEAGLDCAILDVHVGSRTSFDVADVLDHRGIPFMFSSAAGEFSLDERHRHRPLLAKPFADAELKRHLAALLRR